MAVTTMGANAVLAKARALYGKRLTSRNYSEMLSCRTVPEIAAYLKNRTPYAAELEGITPQVVHREQLEHLLRRHLFGQYAALARYETAIGRNLYQYFAVQCDVEHVLEHLHRLNAGGVSEKQEGIPNFLRRYSRLDESKLAQAQNLAQLADALKGTPYWQTVASFVQSPNFRMENDGALEVEAALTRYEYEAMCRLVDKDLKGTEREEVLALLRRRCDLQSIADISRMKRVLKADEPYLRRRVYTGFSALSARQLNRLLDAADEEEFTRRLKTTCYGKELGHVAYEYIEQGVQKIQYRWHSRQLRFSTSPSVVMLCYFFLAENELDNIIHIIEGIRYGMSADEISRMLVGTEQ